MKDLLRMLRDLILIKARVVNLLLQIFWQALKLTSFLIHHHSILAFRLILQLQLRGITCLLDDGSEFALFNGDNIRRSLFLILAILIVFRLVALLSCCFLRNSLFAALDDLGKLKNDI